MSGPGPSVGILDWGIGGTALYRLLKERRPETPVVYFSDTGALPYGRMERPALVQRLRVVVAALVERGVSHLVVACNAASTALPELFRDSSITIPIVGMIEPAVHELARRAPSRAGLLGGRRTVLSRAYAKGLAAYGIRLRARIAQPLSALIEAGDTSSPRLAAECRRIVTPMRGCSHVLLACTHYPAIAPLLRSLLPETVELVDPAPAVLEDVLRLPGLPSSGGADLFLTTGEPEAMRRAAANAFGLAIGEVERVDLGAVERSSPRA